MARFSRLFPCVLVAFALSTGLAAKPPEKRYVIIHSDDAGMSHSVNMGTIDAMENGIVSSCSIMVPCPWFSEFAAYARAQPAKDYGIHLTLTSEWEHYRWGPVTPRSKVPSLVDEQGYLWDNARQVAEHAKVEEVEIELRAQIDRAKAFGVPISHIDTHMGALFSRPDLTKVYVKLAIEYDLPALFVRTPRAVLEAQYPDLAPVADELIRALERARLPVLDRVDTANYGVVPEQKKDYYLKLLRGLRPGVTEIIIHCGVRNAELDAITSSSARRDADRRAFIDPELIAAVKKLGVEVITWKQHHAMRRK